MEKTNNHEVSITKIEVKKENLNDDIKEFAQNAMNELLGWYGYENPREELRIPTTCRSHSDSNSSGLSPKSLDCCGWCGKTVDEITTLSSGATVFCSELCFSHSRRANFKKNKTCDWCRHVKHTVSFVDIQDGASQLQFCSDKCLNQYKMHLFCRETRAHLELHPHHLRVEESSSGTLITPDLWLKNCKSPELRSPSPNNISPKPPEKPFQMSPLSLVSSPRPTKIGEVSDTSKRHLLKSQKKMRKRLPATVTCVTNDIDKISFAVDDVPQDLRIRHTPTEFINKLPTEDNDNIPLFKPIKLPVESRIPSSKPETETRPTPLNNLNLILQKPFHSLIPPPTTLVPYPFIIPIPIPIPIPLPIKRDDKVERKDCSSQTEVEESKTVFGDIDVSGKEVFKVLKRPLKKRKRTYEHNKSKMIMKTRKVILSTN